MGREARQLACDPGSISRELRRERNYGLVGELVCRKVASTRALINGGPATTGGVGQRRHRQLRVYRQAPHLREGTFARSDDRIKLSHQVELSG
jgi:hypothetical protein